MKLFYLKLMSIITILLVFPAMSESKIDGIRSNSLANRIQIVIDLTNQTKYEAYNPSNNKQLVIDIQATPSFNYKNTLSFKERGIGKVRTGSLSNTSSRIILDLKQDYRWNVYSIPAKDNSKNRVVIEVFDKGAYKKPPIQKLATPKIEKNKSIDLTIGEPQLVLESASDNSYNEPIATKPIEPQVTTKIKNKKPTNKPSAEITKIFDINIPTTKATKIPKSTKKHQPVRNSQPVRESEALTNSKLNKTYNTKVPSSIKNTKSITTTKKLITKIPNQKKTIIIIDPGHGGKDSGAVGKNKSKEKNLVLQISKRLRDKINNIKGMKAILTRSSDKYISLRGRLALARKYNADLFISIHADAFRLSSVKGSSVFILSNRGASSEAARWLAKRENSVDLKYGVDIGDYNRDISDVLVKIQQDATIESSYVLAKKTLSHMGRVGKLHKKNVERAGFAVLKNPDIPSILIETAFISNPDEEKKLNSSAYQDKLASSISKSIEKYFDEYLPHHLLLTN